MCQSVLTVGAYALPGVSIAYDVFTPIMWRAVSRGFVSPLEAVFVQNGLRWGFDLGFVPDKMVGKRFFTNYSSALEAREAVSKNLHGRLRSQKSYSLFPIDSRSVRGDLSSFLPSWCVFPLGAVEKPNEPGAYRPISDHARTGFNDASNDDHLRHSLATVPAIGRLLQASFHMSVDDVDAAFPLLPLSPLLWPFFIFAWSHPDDDEEVSWLHWHVCGDFGAKGLPGSFKIFFSDVVIGMARSEGALTLPIVVHVDDMALIGTPAAKVDAEAGSLAKFLALLGILVKVSKHRGAARVQFVLGFWWDSVTRSRSLDESKVLEYVAMLASCATRRSLSLRELQRVAGRLQRAVLTMPPGAACLLANLFGLMRGLLRPGARRRVSRGCADDLDVAAQLLALNGGAGYFAYDRFKLAAPVATDASKSARYAGGGYLSGCGRYSWWQYGSSAARKPIDALEGDTVVKAACDLGHLWRQCRVPFHIDNQAFQCAARKGWSKTNRLSLLIRQLFFISVRCGCIFEFNWISTHDNIFADALSRPDPQVAFQRLVERSPHLLASGVALHQMAGAGTVRGFSDAVDPGATTSSSTAIPGQVTSVNAGPAFSSDVAGDGPTPLVVCSMCPGYPTAPCGESHCPRFNIRIWVPRCPVCKGLARWACTETGKFGDQRQCDAIRCPRKCVHHACFCAIHEYASHASAPPAVGSGSSTEYPGALTSINMGSEFSSDVTGDGPSSTNRVPVAATVQYQRASIFVGLPSASLLASVDEILADRLSGSALASMRAALTHWTIVAARHMWPRVIQGDDPLRGGKLATFVVYLVQETSIKASSIQNYVWALRAWFKHQRQPDPVPGVLEWDDFMRSVSVVAWVRCEPRKAVPLSLIREALLTVDVAVFWEVQAALLMVMLFFTFSRSESPCPGAYSGERGFDEHKHLQVCDVEVRASGATRERTPYVAWRLKGIKQDPRMERPEAAGNQDWTFVGDADAPFSIIRWLHLFWTRVPASADSRGPDSPFFRDHEGQRVLTYAQALKDCRALWARVVPAEEAATYGLHGLRVSAYNYARVHDPALAIAQGGWASQAHTRYERFSMGAVLSLPRHMVQAGADTPGSSVAMADTEGEPGVDPSLPFTPPERPVVNRSGPRLGRARGAGGGSSAGAASSLLSPPLLEALVRARSRLASPNGGGGDGPSASPPRLMITRATVAPRSAPQPASFGGGARARSAGCVRPLPSERVPGAQLPSLGSLGSRAAAFSGRYGA